MLSSTMLLDADVSGSSPGAGDLAIQASARCREILHLLPTLPVLAISVKGWFLFQGFVKDGSKGLAVENELAGPEATAGDFDR